MNTQKPAVLKPAPSSPSPPQTVKGTSAAPLSPPTPAVNFKTITIANSKGDPVEIQVDPTKSDAVKINPLEVYKGSNTFPCYLGFLLPIAIHHTRAPTTQSGWQDWQSYEKKHKESVSADWFAHLEASKLNPVHQHVKGGTSTLFHHEVLLSISFPCSRTRNDIGAALNWLNRCIDEREEQYTKEYRNGLVVIFLKEDWQLFKSKAMRIHINLTSKGPLEDRQRLGPKFSVRYLARSNMNEFATAWANHYATNYPGGKMAPCSRPPADSKTSYKPS